MSSSCSVLLIHHARGVSTFFDVRVSSTRKRDVRPVDGMVDNWMAIHQPEPTLFGDILVVLEYTLVPQYFDVSAGV